jgi:phosphopantothenoylcysteine decarboxylase/phosphopantothenate--cysteine ligase
MKCIVTAGPTYEELDEVRRLTNFSTGTLGTELAAFLAECGHEVELLRGYYSTCPFDPRTQKVQIFTTTEDLRDRLRLLEGTKWDAVFHAAAVSDFKFGNVWSRSAKGKLRPVHSAKYSTQEGNLLAELVPTSKIIAELRGWFSRAQIVGWKYELEGNRREAIARAVRQLSDNKTDACVVNGRAYGRGFGLVTPNGKPKNLGDKKALFDALLALTFRTS